MFNLMDHLGKNHNHSIMTVVKEPLVFITSALVVRPKL